MDKLDSLLMQSSPSTQVFYAGNLCETSHVDAAAGMGHLHVLHAGKLTIKRPLGVDLDISQPSLILFPRPQTCTLIPEATDAHGARIVCAHVDFGQAMSATLALSIPDVLVIPLDPSNHLTPMLALMFQEAASESCGRKVALNH
ncbi:MAG: AraC family transcriptional regulator [Brachymonas sp.]|nr:AraC family transcriptional regulator [Brachymonas sp.]